MHVIAEKLRIYSYIHVVKNPYPQVDSYSSDKFKYLYSGISSRLTPYAEEVIGDHQCGFRHNRSTTEHIFCICQILEKKWEYNEALHQLFIRGLLEKYPTVFFYANT